MTGQIILTREEVREAREDWFADPPPCFFEADFEPEDCTIEFAICRLCKRLTELARGEEDE